MKDQLPTNHCLSVRTQERLLFRGADRKVCLTDAQHEALRSGVGAGKSVLVVSPTSTGKTQIAVWSIARAIEADLSAVYLVTHRALAKQKFNDLQDLLLDGHLRGNKASIILATGDAVEDAEGDVPADPLQAPVLVATYEKYLALLSASGVPNAFTRTVICCDEIQLLGDENRGRNVEILLTLLKSGNWNQFVGLSAVLARKDATELANWLGVELLLMTRREKHLRYECWAPSGICSVLTESPDRKEPDTPLPRGVDTEVLSVLKHLQKDGRQALPIIVFCMSKRQTYDYAAKYAERFKKPDQAQLSLEFSTFPATNANSLLASYLPNRFAIHNADLMDDERNVVERALADGKIDVVFATSTLAAGVNFPLATALFAAWKRWDQDLRKYVPISPAEFHNMAGRAGRMGTEHESGRVVFIATSDSEVRIARSYLDLATLPALEGRVNPERFDQLALQLVASKICNSRSSIVSLVTQTFSGLREETNNTESFKAWPKDLNAVVETLVGSQFLIEARSGALAATPVGKAVAFSGLLPATGEFLLAFAASKASSLVTLLPKEKAAGDLDTLNFALCAACLSTPEFIGQNGEPPTRMLPYPLPGAMLVDGEPYKSLMAEPVWQADIRPVNGAHLTSQWINGAELRALEDSLPELSAGMLREMFRNMVWVLAGFANIVSAAADIKVPKLSQPKVVEANPEAIPLLARLPWIIRRLSYRIMEGLPDEPLWMAQLWDASGKFRLARSEIIGLWRAGMSSPEIAMMGDAASDKIRIATFKGAQPSAEAKANWFRDIVRDWKKEQRRRACERQVQRAKKCPAADLVQRFYSALGTDFERVFEQVLSTLNLDFVRLDDKTKTGAPDYLIKFAESREVVVELKSRDKGNLIDYSRAVEVLAASEVHGDRDKFCVTLCHPGVDPSVPTVVASCGRLCVVESPDFGEALLRLCEGAISREQVWQWLTTPGQALTRDLPFRGQ